MLVKFNLQNYYNFSLATFGITGDDSPSDFALYRWGWLKVYKPEYFD